MTITAEPPRLEPVESVPAPARLGWQRWALLVLLAGTAVLYLWDLNRSGWANAFYSAAAQGGSQSWKAFLFGSSDAANSITVDKPPLSLWLPALGIRLFGLNPWSILVPQALMGVASVAILWDAVRRPFGETAGLIAGLVLALTPVAVTIFRYNNPDALLVLLMIAAVLALLRAVEDGHLRWLLLCGGCLGLGYLTKQLEVALVMPALALGYLVAGPRSPLDRVWRLALALGAALAAAGWWVLLVQLWPADRRPWIGGAQHNSILELTLNYNGIGRLNGDEPGSVASLNVGSPIHLGGRTSAHPWGQPGFGRLFESAQIGGIAWLLPAAVVFGLALLIWWVTADVAGPAAPAAPRRDLRRAAILVWTMWLLTTALVFSFMAGIFHPYYTVVLAPSIAALVGVGTVECWRHHERVWAKAVLALAIASTTTTSVLALGSVPDYHPWLRWAVGAGGIALLCWLLLGGRGTGRPSVRYAVLGIAAVVALGGPTAYSLTTVVRGNSGSMPMAGPVPRLVTAMTKGVATVQRAEIAAAKGPGFLLPAATNGHGPHLVGCTLLESGMPDKAIVNLLQANADAYTWVGATIGSVCAAGYQLASGHPVMPVGGFNGTDPAPAPDEFLRLVLAKRIHYFIVTNPIHEDKWGHLDSNGLIQQWVQRNFTPMEVGRVEVYDLTT